MNNVKDYWKMLWNEHPDSVNTFSRVDFSKCHEVPKNSKLWQSTHMFGFVGGK